MIKMIKRVWRSMTRGYAAAESNRLTAHSKPVNRSADTESQGPFGADALRAWSRQLVRDNAYAWGVVDTIVSNVVGTGITLESTYETLDGEDIANVNEGRQRVWQKWCKVADLTGRLSFNEIQRLALREVVEAGEVLIHFVTVPLDYKGVRRPVPLALELIEADRLASEKDTYMISREHNVRIVRGVELDEDGIPIAYWIYPEHPRGQFVTRNMPERIEAGRIAHLYRQDRVGQSRGVSWFAPVAGVLRDLGLYVGYEMQAAAIGACDMTVVKTDTPPMGPNPGGANAPVDQNGNVMEYYEPGRIWYIGKADSVEHIDPSRPNNGAEPWINLMLRGTAVGTGLSYETVARDYSQTSYSSNRASQLEDRRRYRPTQSLLISDLCERTWRHFNEAAAMIGLPIFPTMSQIDEDFDLHAPAEWHPPIWEWVDPTSEQQASENSIRAIQSTYQNENGKRGQNYLTTFKQAAKEKRERREMGLLSLEEQKIETEYMKAQAALLTAQAAMKNATTTSEPAQSEVEVAQSQSGDRQLSVVEALQKIYLSVGTVITEQEARKIISDQYGLNLAPNVVVSPEAKAEQAQQEQQAVIENEEASLPSGELAEVSTLQFKRNRKAIEQLLSELEQRETTEAKVRVYLASIGLRQETIDALIQATLENVAQ